MARKKGQPLITKGLPYKPLQQVPRPPAGGFPARPIQNITNPTIGKPGFTAPASTPAPAAPKPQGLPIDPAYEMQTGVGWTNYFNTIGGLNYQRDRTKQEYGFDDTSNPYNRAAMLQRSYQQGQQGTTNQMAGQGQLYSGATSTALDEGTFQYNRGYDDLRRQYDDLNQGYGQRELEAQGTLGGLLANAYGERLGRAAQMAPLDPGAVQAGAPPAAGIPGAAYTAPGQPGIHHVKRKYKPPKSLKGIPRI